VKDKARLIQLHLSPISAEDAQRLQLPILKPVKKMHWLDGTAVSILQDQLKSFDELVSKFIIGQDPLAKMQKNQTVVSKTYNASQFGVVFCYNTQWYRVQKPNPKLGVATNIQRVLPELFIREIPSLQAAD
jgi:hypothetical protein